MIKHNLAKDFQVTISEVENGQLKIAVKCIIVIDQGRYEIIIDPKNMDKYYPKKSYRLDLKFIIRRIRLFLTRLIESLKGICTTLELKDFAIIYNVMVNHEIKGYLADQELFSFYLGNSVLEEFRMYCTKRHKQFMRNYSILFNSKISVPIIIGKSFLTLKDITRIREKSIIMLDEFYSKERNNSVNLKIDKLTIDALIQE